MHVLLEISTRERANSSEQPWCYFAVSVTGKLFRNQVQRRNHFRIVHEGKKRIQSKSLKGERQKKLFICDVSSHKVVKTHNAKFKRRKQRLQKI